MISIEKLKTLASKVKFDMDDTGYQTLQEEFVTILKQMELIEEIGDIDDVEPMTFPYVEESIGLREDEVTEALSVDEVLANVKESQANMVKTKKVVG